MFVPLILACTVDASYCAVTTSSVLYETEEDCWADLEQGYIALIQNDIVVVDAICYSWDNPFFDQDL
jgi:hypothetical protein